MNKSNDESVHLIGGADRERNFKYGLCRKYSFCIDANYFKGASFEQYLRKHRRQLIIERYADEK